MATTPSDLLVKEAECQLPKPKTKVADVATARRISPRTWPFCEAPARMPTQDEKQPDSVRIGMRTRREVRVRCADIRDLSDNDMFLPGTLVAGKYTGMNREAQQVETASRRNEGCLLWPG